MKGTTLKDSGSCTLKTLFLNQSFSSVYFLFQQSLLGLSFSFNGRLAYTDHAYAIAISRTGPTVNAAPARSLVLERPPKDRGVQPPLILVF